MITILKGACLLTYLLAALSFATPLPYGLGTPLQYAALVLLTAHALEAVLVFKHVRRYPGPLAVSLLLTLLFGLLHWLPLSRQAAAR